jgi:hypothetical protein
MSAQTCGGWDGEGETNNNSIDMNEQMDGSKDGLMDRWELKYEYKISSHKI